MGAMLFLQGDIRSSSIAPMGRSYRHPSAGSAASSQRRESPHEPSIDLDVPAEHRMRPHPQPAFAIQRAVHHHRLQRLAVPRHAITS